MLGSRCSGWGVRQPSDTLGGVLCGAGGHQVHRGRVQHDGRREAHPARGAPLRASPVHVRRLLLGLTQLGACPLVDLRIVPAQLSILRQCSHQNIVECRCARPAARLPRALPLLGGRTLTRPLRSGCACGRRTRRTFRICGLCSTCASGTWARCAPAAPCSLPSWRDLSRRCALVAAGDAALQILQGLG